MEHELRTHLRDCLAAFLSATGRSRATVSQAAAGDWRFFSRIETGSFTARKYDEVMGWFSANWPDKKPWPRNVPRPAKSERAA